MKKRRPRAWAPALRLQGMGLSLLLACLLLACLGSLPASSPRPDPILVVVVAVAARWGSVWGGTAGLLGGLLMGLVEPALVGGLALIYAGIGWVVGLSRNETSQGPILTLLLTGAATVALALSVSGLGLWLGVGPDLTRVRLWLPGALLGNLLLVLPLKSWLKGWERRR